MRHTALIFEKRDHLAAQGHGARAVEGALEGEVHLQIVPLEHHSVAGHGRRVDVEHGGRAVQGVGEGVLHVPGVDLDDPVAERECLFGGHPAFGIVRGHSLEAACAPAVDHHPRGSAGDLHAHVEGVEPAKETDVHAAEHGVRANAQDLGACGLVERVVAVRAVLEQLDRVAVRTRPVHILARGVIHHVVVHPRAGRTVTVVDVVQVQRVHVAVGGGAVALRRAQLINIDLDVGGQGGARGFGDESAQIGNAQRARMKSETQIVFVVRIQRVQRGAKRLSKSYGVLQRFGGSIALFEYFDPNVVVHCGHTIVSPADETRGVCRSRSQHTGIQIQMKSGTLVVAQITGIQETVTPNVRGMNAHVVDFGRHQTNDKVRVGAVSEIDLEIVHHPYRALVHHRVQGECGPTVAD